MLQNHKETEMKGPDQDRKKSFFGKLIERLDRHMEEKARTKPGCNSKGEGKGKSCCRG